MSSGVIQLEGGGRKTWDDDELRIGLAIDSGLQSTPSLTTEIHPIFARHRWNAVHDEEYNALLPSMRLATNLIHVGMPFLANIMPRDALFNSDNAETQCPDVIPLDPNVTPPQLRAAAAELTEIAACVTWELNYEMYTQRGATTAALEWIGTTRLMPTPRPWGELSAHDIRASDAAARQRGLARRPLVVGLMGEYVRALLTSPEGSEQRLRAAFMAAVTMAHEVAHVVFHSDFRSLNAPTLREPYVGDDCVAELGFAFVCWIFGGWHPNAERYGDAARMDFSAVLFWEPGYRLGMGEKPLYKTLYAISMEYVAEVFVQEAWDELLPGTEGFSSRARQFLKAPTTDDPTVATSRIPNFEYSHATGDFEWKDATFRLPRYRKGDLVHGLTPEEMEYEKELLNSNSELPDHIRDVAEGGVSHEEETVPKSFFSLSNTIDDGILPQDVVDIPPGVSNEDLVRLTRIEILYPVLSSSPSLPLTGKRRPIHPALRINLREKRLHRGRFDQTFDDGSIPLYSSVTAFLASVSYHAISSLTRLQAHLFCIDRHLTGYPRVEHTELWQHSQLTTWPADVAIAHRIIEYLLQGKAARLMNRADAHRLQLQSIENVQHWADEDLLAYCRTHDLSPSTSTSLRTLVVNHKLSLLPDLPALPAPLPLPALVPLSLSPTTLTTALTTHALPPRSSPRARTTALLRHIDAQSRPPQPHRTLAAHEMYVFRAAPHLSSVAALLDALFIAGGFPAAARLSLYFHPHRTHPLLATEPLATYQARDWADLRLSVTFPPTPVAGERREEESLLGQWERVAARGTKLVALSRGSVSGGRELVRELEEMEERTGRGMVMPERRVSHMRDIYEAVHGW